MALQLYPELWSFGKLPFALVLHAAARGEIANAFVLQKVPLMFQWIKTRSSQRRVANKLYGSIVSQARQPEFYRTFGVEDNVSGRFEMICLHVFGVLERLGTAGASETVGRELVERFFGDMDDIMREMGVGDTSVPKKMRTASEGLYGRLDAYGKGVRSEDADVLAAALRRNIFGEETGDGGAASDASIAQSRALGGYVHAMIAHLDGIDTTDVVERGVVTFPDLGGERAHVR